MGGGSSAEILASRIVRPSFSLTSATIFCAESFDPRSDQCLRVMNACAVFMPCPRKLKPVRKVILSMPSRFKR